jgi:hypothetical protein
MLNYGICLSSYFFSQFIIVRDFPFLFPRQVCKLLRHISPTDSLHVQAKYGEINLRIYGPQVAVSARTLCSNPTSKIAKENLEVFVDMWVALMDDVQALASEIADVCRTRAQDKQVYMSLPRPGVCQSQYLYLLSRVLSLLRRLPPRSNSILHKIYSKFQPTYLKLRSGRVNPKSKLL